MLSDYSSRNISPLQITAPLFKAYAHLLDPAADPTCPLYKEEPQTLEHWLQRCPNLDVLRQHPFGSPLPPLGVLTTDPEKVLALARATVLSPRRPPQQQQQQQQITARNKKLVVFTELNEK